MQEKSTLKVNMQLNNLYVILLLLILGIVGLGMFFISRTDLEKTITVSGKSSSLVKNQIARFTATTEINNEDKQTAVKDASERSQAIVEAVKGFGIPEADVETSSLNIYRREEPVFENGVTVYKPRNWYASYSITITLRDLAKSSELTSLLSSFENTSMYGPNLQIDDKKVDEAGLLQDAIADAKIKANAMAAKVNKKVGGVVKITESTQYDNPILYGKEAYATGMGGGAAFPIEAGSTDVQKYVVVTFWIK